MDDVFEREDVDAILSGVFDVNAALVSINWQLELLLVGWGSEVTMEKKRKKTTIPWRRTPEDEERHRQTQKLLADRIAYHRAKIAEERALREREAS